MRAARRGTVERFHPSHAAYDGPLARARKELQTTRSATRSVERKLWETLRAMSKRDRNHALVNGALIAIGALAIVDNVVAHWILGLHRAVAGPWAGPVEVALVVLGAGLLTIGVWRERKARR